MKTDTIFALYLKYFRLVLPAIAFITIALWFLVGQKVAITVGTALIVTDIILLITLTLRSLKKRG